MTNTLKTIDEKIELLKKKKKEAEAKQALILQKKLMLLMDADFSPALILAIIEDVYVNQNSPTTFAIDQEKWQIAATKFQHKLARSKPTKKQEENHANDPTIESTDAPKTL